MAAGAGVSEAGVCGFDPLDAVGLLEITCSTRREKGLRSKYPLCYWLDALGEICSMMYGKPVSSDKRQRANSATENN